MPRLLFVPAVVGITATLLAQSSAPSASELVQGPASAPCTVAGRVVTAAEGNAVKSARVVLIPEHFRSRNQVYAATSDSDGRFTLKDIPPGRYQFLATHSGFLEQHYKAGTNDTGLLFSLTPGEKVSDVVVRLMAAAVIAGRVSNEDGDAMQEVEVIALRWPSEDETEDEPFQGHKIEMQPVASAQTDDRGQYRMFGLKPGEYYIRAEDTFQPSGQIMRPYDWLRDSFGGEYGSVYYPGVTQASRAQVVPVKAGEEVQADVVMHRIKTVEIAGRVIGATGPAARASISLEPADTNDSDFNRHDTTDKKGSFRLRNIPEGTYYLTAYQRDEGSGFVSHGRQKIEVTGDNTNSLTLFLGVGAGTTIQGRLKVDGAISVTLDRIRLLLMPVDENVPLGGNSKVQKDGSFEIKSVPDGKYAITVLGLDSDAYVKSVRCGPDDLLEKGLHVEGSFPGKVDVIISSGGAQLEGSLTANDEAVIGAQVRLVPDPLTPYNRSRIRRTTTDQLRHFSFAGITPGKYKLKARPMLSSESTSYKSEPQSITLSENDHKMIDIKLEKQQE